MDLVLFGAHKEKLVASLTPSCFYMCCLRETWSLCESRENFSSAHLGLMIIRAGHDPTEHPHLLCKLVRICALLCNKFPHFARLIHIVTQLQPYHADADPHGKLQAQLVQPLPQDGSGRFSFCLGRLRKEVKENIARHIT